MNSSDDNSEYGDEVLSQPRHGFNGFSETVDYDGTGGNLNSQHNETESDSAGGGSGQMDIAEVLSRAVAPILAELKSVRKEVISS